MTYRDERWEPLTIEYQGHRVARGWYDHSPTEWRFGNVWYCAGADGEQSRWCPYCCERNGWTWISPNVGERPPARTAG